jgi:predicted NBD/HSP70 family sugar kinase
VVASPRARTTPGTGIDSSRPQNLSAVLRHLHVFGPTSRAELSSVTGLNRSTVGQLLEDLSGRGLVRVGPEQSAGATGRPSAIVSVREGGPLALAIEVFGDTVGAAIVGLGGRIVCSRRVDRPRGFRSPETIGGDVAEVVSAILEDVAAARIYGVGVAIAALVHHLDGMVAIGPNLGWHDVGFRDIIQAAVGLDVPIVIANDANLAALAEHTRGSGTGCDDFILIWGEVGVGAGIVAGGNWVRGAEGFAGEVGHLQLLPDGVPCHCGSRGCWETLIAEDAVLRAIGRSGADEPARMLEAAIAAASRGDETILRGLHEVGTWLGVGIGLLSNTLNPRRIALGGLFARLYPYVSDVINAQMAHWSLVARRSEVDVVPASLGQDAPILGAAELVFSSLLRDPTQVRSVA